SHPLMPVFLRAYDRLSTSIRYSGSPSTRPAKRWDIWAFARGIEGGDLGRKKQKDAGRSLPRRKIATPPEQSPQCRIVDIRTRSRPEKVPLGGTSRDASSNDPSTARDPPPLKWSDLRYVFDIQEDCNGKEAIQA